MVQIRKQWPKVEIIVHADSGCCREELLKWCQENSVSHVIGRARNERLRRTIEPQMQEAARQHAQTGKPARVFTEFDYQTTSGSWSRARRIVSKCEQIEGKENPRYVVSNLSPEQWPAPPLYQELYGQH